MLWYRCSASRLADLAVAPVDWLVFGWRIDACHTAGAGRVFDDVTLGCVGAM